MPLLSSRNHRTLMMRFADTTALTGRRKGMYILCSGNKIGIYHTLKATAFLNIEHCLCNVNAFDRALF